jgi:hypothetical protein
MLDRIDLPQGTLDLLILRTLAQRHPGKSVGRTQAFFKTTGGCEGGAGTAAPFFKQDDIGRLRAGAHPSQASDVAQGSRDDSGRSQCAAECSKNVRRARRTCVGDRFNTENDDAFHSVSDRRARTTNRSGEEPTK